MTHCFSVLGRGEGEVQDAKREGRRSKRSDVSMMGLSTPFAAVRWERK